MIAVFSGSYISVEQPREIVSSALLSTIAAPQLCDISLFVLQLWKCFPQAIKVAARQTLADKT